MKISKDRLKSIIMQEVRNIMETKKGKDKKTGRPDDEAFVADEDQEEVEGGKETGEEAFTTKKGMKKKNEGRRITKSALLSIVREEMQSIREKAQLDEGLGANALLGVILAVTGMTGNAIVQAGTVATEIETALRDANPDDIERATAELKKHLGSCTTQSDTGSETPAKAAASWISSNQKAGTGGF